MRSEKKKNNCPEIAPDEVLLDNPSLVGGDVGHQDHSTRMEMPLSGKAVFFLGLVFILLAASLLFRVGFIQIVEGESYVLQSERNRMNYTPLFAERGIIYDRNDNILAWNELPENEAGSRNAFSREYTDRPGLAHILGYIQEPRKDKFGFYYQEEFKGLAGVEKSYDPLLSGQNGMIFLERGADMEIRSQNRIKEPKPGDSLTLSIDTDLQEIFYQEINSLTEEVGFQAGAGVMMDVETGQLIVATSYPEFDLQAISRREDEELLQEQFTDQRNLFLNRSSSGTYVPGSVVKPFVALAALEENVISPDRQLTSAGTLTIPNPYDPTRPSIFTDWQVHGDVDMRRALAVSSNIYFYKVGGGYGDLEGLGIHKMAEYFDSFGLGKQTGVDIPYEKAGNVPTPQWKAEQFQGDMWRLGDTYNTSIGQYGFTITPMQLTKATAALANGGKLHRPTLRLNNRASYQELEVSSDNLRVIQEGMRAAVQDSGGTARALQFSELEVAAKTGTAERGTGSDRVNSWVTGYFPYQEPRYAFTILMINGPADNLIGGSAVMRNIIDQMLNEFPQYVAN